jgi:phage shock protein PspC (stress-responsive transcriptional regulator)
MKTIRYIIEQQAFGVCTYLGDRLGISTSRIRLYFIYTSFLTFGSPVIIYLIMAFWLNIKNHLKEGHRSVWDL